MKKIRVTLSQRDIQGDIANKEISLYWNLKANEISKKYFEALKIASDVKYIYHRDRFYNFPTTSNTEDKIVRRLNKAIATINKSFWGLVPERAHIGMTQTYMNYLHVYFEKYRGPLLNPTPLYSNASWEVREAFDELNIAIHYYEDSILRKDKGHTPLIHLNFGISDKVKRYAFADSDYDEFNFITNFGNWMISYCEVGKPLHDIWRDADAVIGQEVVIPLRYYSADGLVSFGTQVGEERAKLIEKQFYAWWDEKRDQIEALGFRKYDKKNSLGNIVVAELDREENLIKGKSDTEIVKLISDYQWVSSVDYID